MPRIRIGSPSGEQKKTDAVFEPQNRAVAAPDYIAAAKPRAGLRALRMGAPQFANVGRADERQITLGVTDLIAVANTQHVAGVAQSFDRTGEQIPITDRVPRRFDGVSDNFRICPLGFHALPEQPLEFVPALRWACPAHQFRK